MCVCVCVSKEVKGEYFFVRLKKCLPLAEYCPRRRHERKRNDHVRDVGGTAKGAVLCCWRSFLSKCVMWVGQRKVVRFCAVGALFYPSACCGWDSERWCGFVLLALFFIQYTRGEVRCLLRVCLCVIVKGDHTFLWWSRHSAFLPLDEY